MSKIVRIRLLLRVKGSRLFRMPRGIPLNDFQKCQSVAYKNDGKCVREIASCYYTSVPTQFLTF